MKFKKILATVLGRTDCCNDDGFPSVNLALKAILGEKLFGRLILSTPDRRQLVEEAARLKGITEDELTKIIAEKLEVPVFFKPKPIDLERLPDGITIRDLRRYGVYPLINQELLSGIICVDPAELSNISNLYKGTNIYLTSWSALLSAIEESEQLYLHSKTSRDKKSELIDQQLVAKLLGRLLQEMDFKKSENLLFEDNLDCVLYTFRDQNDLSWQGRIDHEAGKKLIAYLHNRIASGRPDLTFFGFGSLIAGAENGQLFIRRAKESNVIMFPGNADLQGAELSRQQSKRFNVLLIDDNPSYLDIMQGYLNKQGFDVTALTGIKSVKTFLECNRSPDLIVSDLNLQDGTALSLLHELKSSARHSDLPFIVLSSDKESELKVLGMGADAFMSKNQDPRILTLHIKRLLKYRAAA